MYSITLDITGSLAKCLPISSGVTEELQNYVIKNWFSDTEPFSILSV